ncbi:MAG: hypothetical protein ACI8WT_003177 [Clostridium sp.]|jgi:hypothetical protein
MQDKLRARFLETFQSKIVLVTFCEIEKLYKAIEIVKEKLEAKSSE